MMTGSNSVATWDEVKEGWIIAENKDTFGGDEYVQYIP